MSSRKPARIYQEDSDLVLETPYRPHLIEMIKSLPGRWWDGTVWRVPVRHADAVLEFAQGIGIPMEATDPQVRAVIEAQEALELEALRHKVSELQELVRGRTSFESVPGLRGELTPWQWDAVRFAAYRRHVLIADDMGVGKTLEALATLALLGSQQPIVICPATAKLTWANEIKRFFPSWGVMILLGTTKGTIEEFKNAEVGAPVVRIVNYDILRHWITQLEDYDALVFDESHKLKNPQAARTKAAMKLIKNKRLKSTLLLSGTPIVNYPAELIPQLQAIEQLKYFGGWQAFVNRYCFPYRDNFGFHMDGATHLKELNLRLRSSCMIRRLKEEVMSSRQPPQINIIHSSVSARDKRLYELQAAKVRQHLLDDDEKPTVEISDLDALLGEPSNDQETALGALSKLRAELGRMKAGLVVDWVREFLEDTDSAAMSQLDGRTEAPRKLVVYAEHHALVDALTEELHPLRVTGRETMDARQRAIELFQNDPEQRVIVISAAGNENITLTAASDMLFAELPWTPKDLTQAIARIDRQGQTQRVSVHELVVDDTIDIDVLELLSQKLEVSAEAIDGRLNTGTEGRTSIGQLLLDRMRKPKVEKIPQKA